MNVLLNPKERAAHQVAVMKALESGLHRHGVGTLFGDAVSWEAADALVVWGAKNVPAGIDIPYLVLEAGYINGQSGDYVADRLRFVSAGWNGMHGRADPLPSDCPPDRWDALGVELAPWDDSGEYVLICGQHPGDAAAPGCDERWAAETYLAGNLGLRVVYRPHPLTAPDLPPLSESLACACQCVTWNSTAAVEAVIAGVPTVALDRGSIAWEVASHAVLEPLWMGNRDRWAYNLAYRQWTLAELADGTAWEYLRYGLADRHRTDDRTAYA